MNNKLHSVFSNTKLSDAFHCVTGISTGSDKQYLSGMRKKGYNLPFYKNPGTKKFYSPPNAYMIDSFLDISQNESTFMVRNKRFLFEEGIVCSSMGLPFSACYLPKNSTFGVNAGIFCSNEDLYWMLSYLNSSLITYFVSGVLIRSNMVTSGYVSNIPIIPLSAVDKGKLALIAHQLVCNEGKDNHQTILGIKKINSILYSALDFNDEDVCFIEEFANNLSKRV